MQQIITGVGNSGIAPLLKWPGGKRGLASKILEAFPETFNHYYEPFFGGGAIFFALLPSRATLSDLNAELIECYATVRDNPEAVIEALKRLPNSEETYYKVRASRPRKPETRAARTLYLARLAFNGIHRVNLAGQFNVPYGRKTHLASFDADAIRATSAALQGHSLVVGDFEAVTAHASSGDLIYFDPPYTVAHATNGFVKYNERIFSWQDQIRLAEHARQLSSRGCTVIVSNADHQSVKSLYSGADATTFSRYSVISAASEHRRQITECMFVMQEGA